MKKVLMFLCSVLLVFGMVSIGQATTYDFESGSSYAEFTGGTVDGTFGYSSHGFGDYFLWSGGSTISLTLTGLAAHTSIDLDFLLAVVDSWDGSFTSVAPDSFNVSVDGSSIFKETFDNFASSDQSYTGTPLVDHTANLYKSSWADSAYNMGADTTFQGIAHTSSSLTVSWWADGNGWQGGFDESFAIDNIDVTLNGGQNPVPEPSTILLLGVGLLGMAGLGRKHFNKKS
jgi:hypothetical protein